MSSLRLQDRVSLCRFTFADGRQCRTPRSPNHPHFCFDHAREESQACAADKLARELAYFLSGEYLSACDLSVALGRLVPAAVRGDIKPRVANPRLLLPNPRRNHPSRPARIRQRLGTDSWRNAVRHSVRQNFAHGNPPPPEPPPTPLQAPPQSPTPVESTLIEIPASVDSKPLT